MPKLSDLQPPLLSSPELSKSDPDRGSSNGNGNSPPPAPRRSLFKSLLIELSSLPKSIAVLGLIAFLSSVGTIIEQGKSSAYYIEKYPDGPNKVLGFLTSDWIFALDLNHIYSSWYFLLLLTLLAAQLSACTYTRQFPLLKIARRWKFPSSTKILTRVGNAEILPSAQLRDLGKSLKESNFEVFIKEDGLYAFKGLAGRIAPIGVHASMLLALAGMVWGIFGGFKGTAMVPEGQEFTIERAWRPNSPVAIAPASGKNIVHVDNFKVDYNSDGSVEQFYSQLSILDEDRHLITNKEISVNDPLRSQGVTMYQSSWSMAAMNLVAKGSPLQPEDGSPMTLAMASLKGRKGISGQVWATFIPTGETKENGVPLGVSALARDFQSVVLYDSKGEFAGVRRPTSGTPITIDGMDIVIQDIVGSTGLEIKSDPGVPLVYAGFGGMMLTTLLSYLSHSQVWALQVGRDVHVGGKTNRATVEFEDELSTVIDRVPEVEFEAPDVTAPVQSS
ncbi:hypothetical protein BSKO_00605 [Bryopsis sp. KO-2023]|nr:hypothetical protein BSKO_00605 [Bryopsis sp. KO-2023]